MTMSQRSAAVSYHLFAAGCGICLFVLFHYLADKKGKVLTCLNHWAQQALMV